MPRLYHVVVPLHERDHAEENHVAGTRTELRGFHADAANQELLPLLNGESFPALIQDREHFALRKLDLAERCDSEGAPVLFLSNSRIVGEFDFCVEPAREHPLIRVDHLWTDAHVIVASELDGPTERIIGYLNARDIAINAVFFQVFQHGEEQLLSRAWLIDPSETQAHVAQTSKRKGEKEPWNGEFYVSFGDTSSRSWEDARRYGFISAGGGSWYTQTLKLLTPGDRVWANIPRTGFVGVGRVTEAVRPVGEFTVPTSSGERAALDVLTHADRYRPNADDPEKAEHFVRVTWLDTVPESKAVEEVGLFGNQNTVCRPMTPQWRHTVERLKTYFPRWDHTTNS